MTDEEAGRVRDFVGYGRNPPDPKWPNGAHVAVNFVINYEEGGELAVPDGDAASETGLTEGSTAGVKGRDLGAESQNHTGPIAEAYEEPGDGRHIELGPGAERAWGWMCDCHLGQAAHQQKSDEGAYQITEKDGRAGKSDGKAGSQKQARTNGAPDRNHGKLSRRKTPPKPLFAFLDGVKFRG